MLKKGVLNEMKNRNPFLFTLILWACLLAIALTMVIYSRLDDNLLAFVWNLCCVVFDSIMLGFFICNFVGFREFQKKHREFEKMIKELESKEKDEPFKEFENDKG